jgi:hypothetical protein
MEDAFWRVCLHFRKRTSCSRATHCNQLPLAAYRVAYEKHDDTLRVTFIPPHSLPNILPCATHLFHHDVRACNNALAYSFCTTCLSNPQIPLSIARVSSFKKDGRQSLSVAFPSLQIHLLALYHLPITPTRRPTLALAPLCSIAYLRSCSPQPSIPASQTPLLLTTSCTPQPNQLLAHDASRPSSQSACKHERHAGSDPSLAEGYICTSRSSSRSSNPTPSLRLLILLLAQPLFVGACRRMGGLQVHLDIGGSSRGRSASPGTPHATIKYRAHHEVRITIPPLGSNLLYGFAYL